MTERRSSTAPLIRSIHTFKKLPATLYVYDPEMAINNEIRQSTQTIMSILPHPTPSHQLKSSTPNPPPPSSAWLESLVFESSPYPIFFFMNIRKSPMTYIYPEGSQDMFMKSGTGTKLVRRHHL
jgi:hypothetical protein